jgi:hypothetical protein
MKKNVRKVKHVDKVAKNKSLERHLRSLNLSTIFTFFSTYYSDPYLIQMVKDTKAGKYLFEGRHHVVYRLILIYYI